MKIVIVVFDQFTDLDVFFPWDVLNRVRLVSGIENWEVKLVGTDTYHTSMAGLSIPMHGTLSEINSADAVIFSSGIGVRRLVQDESYLSELTSKLRPNNQLIGSMCSGALLLGATGILTGKTATTYPTSVKLLEAYGVTVLDTHFVQEDNVATAAGCLAAQDLSSWVIETLLGKDIVDQVFESIRPVGDAHIVR